MLRDSGRRGRERNAEMKMHFTVMLLLLCLQRQKRNPSAMSFESDSRANVTYCSQVRRLKCDLTMCYKIIHSNAVIHNQDFVIYSDYLSTRGHKYKLFKRYSSVNAYKNSFINRICDIWNLLPDTAVEASDVNTFKSRLDSIDLRKHCIF